VTVQSALKIEVNNRDSKQKDRKGKERKGKERIGKDIPCGGRNATCSTCEGDLP
jgi:hypothetical protein